MENKEEKPKPTEVVIVEVTKPDTAVEERETFGSDKDKDDSKNK